MPSPAAPVHDTAARRTPVVAALRDVGSAKGLLGVLIRRDLTVRYKRSVLGVWWTLLNPILTTAVMWMVFSQLFKFATPGVPYVVYLLSGVLMVTLFSQGIQTVGAALVGNAGLMRKIWLPGEVFGLAAAGSAGINAAASLAPLFALQLLVGVGIPLTAFLAAFPILLLLAFVTGIGLVVSVIGARYHDVFQLTTVAVSLLSFLTPTFYPRSIVPPRFRILMDCNPVVAHLQLFRDLTYGGTLGDTRSWLIACGSAATSLFLGLAIFDRSRHQVVRDL